MVVPHLHLSYFFLYSLLKQHGGHVKGPKFGVILFSTCTLTKHILNQLPLISHLNYRRDTLGPKFWGFWDVMLYNVLLNIMPLPLRRTHCFSLFHHFVHKNPAELNNMQWERVGLVTSLLTFIHLILSQKLPKKANISLPFSILPLGIVKN